MVPILIITAIGLVCGAAIYLGYLKIPNKVVGLEKTEEINGILPGRNCAACGYPGCFGYAQALTANPEMVKSLACGMTAQDPDRVARLGQALGISLDASAMAKKALPHCGGASEKIYDYSGVESCKAVNLLMSGNKKCPYACLGLGDCVKVCPEGAIKLDETGNHVEVDWSKCTGCGLCAKECPKGLIELVPAGTKVTFRCAYTPIRSLPGRERCDSGCIHCQKCFKACESEAITWNKERMIPEFDDKKCIECGKCVEACPKHVLTLVSQKAEKEAVTA